MAINKLICHHLLLFICQETKHEVNCVFLEDLYASQDCQEWLDVQCLDQVMITDLVMLP